MKLLNPTLKQTVCSGALLLGLLLVAARASALSSASPATATARPAAAVAASDQTASPQPGQSGQTPLTPATSVASKVPPTHSEEDIRDIRQPRHLPGSWPWAVVAAGVLTLLAAAFAAWKWLRRATFRTLLPGELALQELAQARGLMDPEHAREYCFAVSGIIRGYLEHQFQLRAPRLTTEEFLRDLVDVRETMLASHRALLGNFLEHCDLAKFAGWRYSLPALEEMHSIALTFVKETSASSTMTTTQDKPAPPSALANASVDSVPSVPELEGNHANAS